MDVLQVSRFLAVLALAAQIAVGLWVILTIGSRFSAATADLRDRIALTVNEFGLWAAAAVALIATTGSLYYSEIANFIPCELCWYQRIAMYPIVIVLLVGAWRKDRATRLTGLILAGAGIVLSTYHYVIQLYPSLETTSCSTVVPCTAAYLDIFGFISIPYMAWSAFALIISILWATKIAEGVE